jgi:cell division septation protein DedD
MSIRYLIAAALLLAAPGPLTAQSVKSGIEAWQRADYSDAVAIWRPLAEKGDADAQFNLGQAYRLGRGVATNLAAAQTWFERAAKQGHLDAQTTLGLLLFQNGDRAEGLKWLKQAADRGESRAQLVYGTALVNGDSVTQDPVLGYSYVSRAAAQGLEPARQTLAQMDQILPPADRKKGVAIALAEAKGKAASAKTPENAGMRPVEAAKAKITKTAESKAVGAPAVSAKPKPAPKREPVETATRETEAPRPASGGWRIQLGAFSRRSNAEALYDKVSANSALEGRTPYYVPAGAVTRLQVGPFESKAAAASACRGVGVACFPVAAR